MNAESKQLEELYRSISAQFVNHPLIRIEAVKGDPPEQYEVTYKIPCAVKTPDGRIVQQSGHTVIITIPFGFPHFSPTCKPKGQIFHPDFDSAAICLGDFWQNNRDLGDLIRHIGAMLSGEIYSTENTFNEEAARWYLEHRDQLPFAVTGLTKSGWSPDEAVVPEGKKEDNILTLELDVLEEEERNAQEKNADGALQGPPAALGGDLSSNNQEKSARLWELSQKKQFMRLKRELDALELGESIEGQEALVQKTHAALAEARELYRQADDEECQGEMEKAAALYAQVADKVADFPDIDMAIQRAQNTKNVLNDLYKPPAPPVPVRPGEPPASQAASGKGRLLSIRKKDKALTVAQAKTAPIYSRKLHIGIVPLTAVACLVILVAAFGFLWLLGTDRLGEADGLLSQCRQAMVDLDFYRAETTCQNAQRTADSVMFGSIERKDTLLRNVRTVLESEEFRQGMLGNILIEGRYVAKDAAEQQKIFQNALKEATIAGAAGQWSRAANEYRKALAVEEAYSAVRVDSRLAIEQQLALAETRLFLEKAQESLSIADKSKALEYLLGAQKSVTKVSPEAIEELSATINSLLAQRQFADLKEQADHLLEKSDWQGAHALFQQAILLGRELSASQQQEAVGDVRKSATRAGLYAAIEEGNRAFGNGKWDEALGQYGIALGMARNDALGFTARDQDKLRSWLMKLILQTNIIQNRQRADLALKSKHIDDGKGYLQRIVTLIRMSPFSSERQFFVISNETKEKLEQLDDDEFIADKTKYLMANYKQLFQSHSPDVKTDNLDDPKVSFVGKRKGRYLFQVLCKQRGSGVTLKMQFLHDPSGDRWLYYADPD
ncbi:MAG: hypothetical protein LBU39_03200 [Desulfobulbaceae bacterium]|jgi:ubiquitin-protein ligase|nr:hypothetical protein [Desulfobulbaceae bacterium]